MNKEEIERILQRLNLGSELTPNEFCYLKEYIKDLQKEKDHYKHLYSEVKKQKDDVVIKYIKYLIKRLEEFDILERKETGAFWYQVMGELKELLRMLGEIDG